MKKVISTLLALLMIASSLVIVASAASKDPYGTVVEVQYAKTAPSMAEAMPDSSWGEKIAHIDAKSPNTGITTYHKENGTVRSDISMDIYARWDDNNFYFCMVSDDNDIIGSYVEPHRGDGFQLDAVYGIVDMSHYSAELASSGTEFRDNYSYAVTFAGDDSSADWGGAAYQCEVDPVVYIDKNTKIVCKIVIPLTLLGKSKKAEAKDGDFISFSMLRVEATKADEYLGWLEWGDFFNHSKETSDMNTGKDIELESTKTGNTFKFVGKSTPATTTPTTTPATTETPTTPTTPATTTEKPSSWAADEVAKAIEAGLVPTDLQKNYTKGISRADLSKMLSALLDKVYGKAPTSTSAKFSDTTDAAVLKAANLGIINGYKQADGSYMFKPANTLKRSEMSAIINRVAKLCGKTTTGYDSEVKFTDTASHWCNSELGYPVHMGIVKGTSATTFSPENTLTVEQTIMMIYRTYQALK